MWKKEWYQKLKRIHVDYLQNREKVHHLVVKKITLLDKKKKPHISLEFNSPLVALWSPTKTHPDCPFVCIEPWYGRCDSVGYSGELKDREWIQKLEPKETFDVEYKIIIE